MEEKSPTGVLDTMLHQHSVAPVTHAPHSLDVAIKPITTLREIDFTVVVSDREAVFELAAHFVPLLAQRVPRDGGVVRRVDVMRERQPVEAGVVFVLSSPLTISYPAQQTPKRTRRRKRTLRCLTSFQRSVKCCTMSSTTGPCSVMCTSCHGMRAVSRMLTAFET